MACTAFSLKIVVVQSDSSASPWTIARKASLSMGFSRQEYWSGLPFPPQGDLPNAGNEPAHLLHWQADSLPLSHWGSREGNGNPVQYSCLENPMDGGAW